MEDYKKKLLEEHKRAIEEIKNISGRKRKDNKR